MTPKKYRNAVTFTDRNNVRLRIRQKNTSFSKTVNEDLTAFYDILDCISIDMQQFFAPPQKWQYYCDALRDAEIYKHTPWAYAREIGLALEDGAYKGLDTKYGVDAKALAQEARTLNLVEAFWVLDRIQKSIKSINIKEVKHDGAN